MAESMSAQERIALINENLQEVLKPDIIEDVIVRQGRPLVVYWGTATTGRPHCGYFVPMMKLAQFLRAGCRVKLLLADIHGFLDNLKAPIELVNFRAEYYRHVITSLLRSVNVSVERLEFVLGSSYQLSAAYTMDLFRLSAVVTEHDAKKAGAEVVKQVANPLLSGLLYPLMQALDEQHLDVDAQFGGVDQRKIFTLAAEQLPKIGYRERAHLMNPMVPGLAGGKMSASDPDSKIDLLDGPDVVRKKLKKAYAVPKEVDGNGIISFVEYVLLPVSALQNDGRAQFVVEKREGEGEPATYTSIAAVKEDYKADKLTPQLLKIAVTTALISLLAPIQADYVANAEWQDVALKAYPPPPEKKKKAPKNKGSRHPGAGAGAGGKDVEVEVDGSVKGEGSETVAVGKGQGSETVSVGKVEEGLEKLAVKQSTGSSTLE
ncbi:MAG: hypothetical protein M1832_002350 [Thelocarpon impressellum]|nr:MAG: hypothetical protein M1832_002350 [Thelocarpon impressellum]